MELFRIHVKRHSAPRGFTLIEMVVVLAIIVIITAIVLNSQNDFNRTLTVTDTAYTVALSIRQAQTFGLSSRTFTTTTNAAYGAHFASSTPKSYLLFADVYPVAPGTSSAYCPGHNAAVGNPDAKPGNCMYDASQGELTQNFSFGRGFQITNICGHDTSNTLRCTSTGYLTGIDVVFLRPNTDSVVVGLTSGTNVQLLDASITVTAPSGSGTRLICVTQAGEISVASSTCP